MKKIKQQASAQINDNHIRGPNDRLSKSKPAPVVHQSQPQLDTRDLSEDRRRQNAIKQGGEAIIMSGPNRKSLNGPPTE